MWKRIGICWWLRVCVMWKWAFSLFELEIVFLDNNDKYVLECYILFWKNSCVLQHSGSLAFVGHNLNFSDGMCARNCYLTFHIYWSICMYVFIHNFMLMYYPQLYWRLNCAALSCLFLLFGVPYIHANALRMLAFFFYIFCISCFMAV
jgi:hypothetical protein